MNTSNPSLVLSTAIFGLLTVATFVGYILKWRTANGRPHAVIDNLNQRSTGKDELPRRNSHLFDPS